MTTPRGGPTSWDSAPEIPFFRYPRDARARMELREKHFRRAVREARQIGLSINCQTGKHQCANDGTTCLCWCHDDGGTA